MANGHGHHGEHRASSQRQPGDAGHHGGDRPVARCLVVTVSDTRTLEDDPSGDRACELLCEAGHEVRERGVVRDDRQAIAAVVRAGAVNPEIDAVLLTGGTGLAPRDVTPEAVAEILERRLDGFGELFRMLSFEEIGPAAMLSRAVAGTIGRTVIFALPGSTAAVDLGVRRLIVPELAHIAGLLSS